MSVYIFANNAETTLAVALDATPGVTTMTVTVDDTDNGTAAAFPEFSIDNAAAVMATLSHPTNPGLYEVVEIQARSGPDFTVLRGAEGDVLSWPVGTLISARITAKVMGTMLQSDPETGVIGTYDGAVYLQFAGTPCMQLYRSSGLAAGDADYVVTPESWVGTIPVDLGTAATWSTANFSRGSVVLPTTPDGKQYWLEIPDPADTVSADATEPTWGVTAPSTNGIWHQTALPVNISSGNLSSVLITEVGFIAHKYSASTPASVSIGTNTDATRFVNNQSLSQITADGCVHRFPLTAGGLMVPTGGSLRFKVETAAAGGRCLGRFYWRGIFIETNASL